MSPGWDDRVLLDPVAADAPCGKSLDYTDTLASLDAFEIFGQTTLEPAPRKPGDPTPKGARKSDRPPNWPAIRDEAIGALRLSKDLRVLAYLAAATVRMDGIAAFAKTLDVATQWLVTYPSQVYPLIDEDALFRQNALNCLADPLAVVDAVRRAPLVSSRQHGRFSLRDVEIAAGDVVIAENEVKPDGAAIRAAFEAVAIEELAALHETLTAALASIASIDGAMREAHGAQFAPNFDTLSSQLKSMGAVVRPYLAARSPDAGEAAGAVAAHADATGVIAAPVGAIRSREDAIRALDAAVEFFRRNEPSSPIPMFLERAKRLVSKDFLEVLADVAPDALPQAKSAGGIRDEY
jgi:type VI secretion system protein ImpA